MPKWLTVLGGAHSGKTDLVSEICGSFKTVGWWGTALEHPQDADWQGRLEDLRAKRNQMWKTFDGPWAWPEPASAAQPKTENFEVFVFDCLNLWLAAHIHRGTSMYSIDQLRVHLEMEFAQLLKALSSLNCSVVVVSAEVGSGVVPTGEAGRLFRDLLSLWNRQIVQQSDYGVSMQAGRAFLWPAGRSPLAPEGSPVLCVGARNLSLLLGSV